MLNIFKEIYFFSKYIIFIKILKIKKKKKFFEILKFKIFLINLNKEIELLKIKVLFNQIK